MIAFHRLNLDLGELSKGKISGLIQSGTPVLIDKEELSEANMMRVSAGEILAYAKHGVEPKDIGSAVETAKLDTEFESSVQRIAERQAVNDELALRIDSSLSDLATLVDAL